MFMAWHWYGCVGSADFAAGEREDGEDGDKQEADDFGDKKGDEGGPDGKGGERGGSGCLCGNEGGNEKEDRAGQDGHASCSADSSDDGKRVGVRDVVAVVRRPHDQGVEDARSVDQGHDDEDVPGSPGRVGRRGERRRG